MPGKLKTRLYVMLRGPLSMLEPEFRKGPLINYGNHHLSVRAIKIGADGALGSRGAALLEPYTDEPGTSGFMTTPPNEIYAQTLAASRAGFQTCVHAIGDRANRVTLDVFERVQGEVPGARDLRMRNEHAQILDAAEIPRFAKLNVIASMQTTHATSDMPWVPARIGQARARGRRLCVAAAHEVRRRPRERLRFPGGRTKPDARLLRRDHAAGSAGAARGRLDA